MAEKDDWAEGLGRVVLAFRLGHDGEGNELLGRFIDGLLRLLPSVNPSQMNGIQIVLVPMLQAQERGDYLFLADLLEYELAPLLSRMA